MDGFICVNKPLGMTSSDVVIKVRRMLPKGTKVGHGGTLDPEASGVLPVCVGSAVRLFDYIIDKEKTYKAVIKLGQVTDTQDATGKIIEEHDVNVTKEQIEDACAHFVGDIMQIPPMFSAIKKDGKRLYKLARDGQTVEVEARACRVENITLGESLGENRYEVTVVCRKGVYIRTICHDIGQYLGCGAHMAALERVNAGAFTIEDSKTIEELARLKDENELESAILPVDYPIKHIPMIELPDECMHAVKNGNPIKKRYIGKRETGIYRMYIGGTFCGMGEIGESGDCVFKAMLMRFGN